MAETRMDNIIDKFSDLTANPVKYLSVQDDIKDDVKSLVKSLYDFTKSHETRGKKKRNGTLSELIVDDFDEEQIWQQLELQNTECWDQLVWDVANCISNKNDLHFPIEFSDREQEVKQKKAGKIVTKSNPTKNDGTVSQTVRTKSKPKDAKPHNKKTNLKTSIVDDKFFKLTEMEKFLINEEKNEGKTKKSDDDEESIDLFEDIDDDGDDPEEGGTDMMYKDFFQDDDNAEIGDEDGSEAHENDIERDEAEDDDIEGNDVEMEDGSDEIDEGSDNMADEDDDSPQKGKSNEKKVRFAGLQPDSNSESDDDSEVETEPTNITDNEKKSEFELRQQRLKQQITKLEEKTLTDKPWQLKGEVDATKRPQNSLLQEVLDFDLTTRPAPIITEQTTVTLEGLIRQRIKDKAWDDVVKKERPVDDQLTFKKTEVLDHAKSKQSLAQVYEAEYLKQKQALSGDIEEEEPESHKEIREAMSKLFSKLDALCHYHYTPKAPQAEVKIVSNTPAISMEEVAPVATSEATLLAPEEVKKKQKGDLMSKDERTQTDKNRERRKKKKLQRKKGGQVTKVTDHRNTTKGVEASDKSLKTSKAFFQQLNDNTTSIIKNKHTKNKKK